MQDRFKFRIIVEKNDKTINGNFKGNYIYYCNGFIQTKTKTYFFGDNKRLSFLNSQIKAIHQCTGRKDENDKLIYEDDLLKDPKGQIGKVFYNQSSCSYAVNWKMKDGSYETDNCIYYGEVIGNIYENKDLLKENDLQKS